MNRVLALLATLRCIGCQRAPTPAEIREMQADFGHKLKRGDDAKSLVWRCLACIDKAKSAGVS